MADREAKKVKLLKSNGPVKGTESAYDQDWQITDHKGKSHSHKTRAGHGDEPTGRSLNKKYAVEGKPTTAREILGSAISTGGVADEGEEREVHRDPKAGGFAFR